MAACGIIAVMSLLPLSAHPNACKPRGGSISAACRGHGLSLLLRARGGACLATGSGTSPIRFGCHGFRPGPTRSRPPRLSEGIDEDDARLDPYAVLGLRRDAPMDEIRSAYRKRARELHPDASGDPSTAAEFRQLVVAFKAACEYEPGSLETHPLWAKLSGLDRYWARELGYVTAEGLEEWLVMTSKIDDYIDEDGQLLPGIDPSSLEAESAREGSKRTVPTAVSPAVQDDAISDPAGESAEAMHGRIGEQGGVTSVAESSASGIASLLGYRVFLGNEQWRVRWVASTEDAEGQGGEVLEETWEVYNVLDTDSLRRDAERLRAHAQRESRMP